MENNKQKESIQVDMEINGGKKKNGIIKKICIAIACFFVTCILFVACVALLPEDNSNDEATNNDVVDQKEIENTTEETEEEKVDIEAKRAKERRKKAEELAQSEPYEGMEAEYIDWTSFGAHDYDENAWHGSEDKYDLLCYWHTRDTTERDRSWFARIYIKDGKVTDIQSGGYKNDDGSFDFDAIREDRQDNEKILSGDPEVDDAWTGKEYADEKLETYLEIVEADDKYKSLDNEKKEDIAWMLAFDYWLGKKSVEHYDTEDYYDTIRNSKK